MKKLKNRIKNNIMYYWSVIGLAVTGSVCHIIHYVKTGRLPPPPQKNKVQPRGDSEGTEKDR